MLKIPDMMPLDEILDQQTKKTKFIVVVIQ